MRILVGWGRRGREIGDEIRELIRVRLYRGSGNCRNFGYYFE